MSGQRMIVEIVSSCDKCAWCHYESNYSRSSDSGHDCNHPDGQFRIIDDQRLPITGIIPIPEKCPLPKVS